MDRLTKAQMEFMNGYVPATIHDIYDYQEGGVAQGDQGNAQMMQAIQKYAELLAQESGDDPNKVYQDVMQQLQQLKPDQQKEALKIILNKVQGASQQPAMQMGGDPSQMQQAPQQQGGDAEQLIQQIQQMLQQGAQPQEVIAQLLQLQIDPQMIVEIFVQLGMPQEQVVQAVQEVMQQMGAGQEQEVPQEQMQEQGMEEPAPQGMKDGGITKYPYGGMYANKKYYADFLPQDALNNAMTDINMLAGPTAAMANIKPLKGAAAVAGIAEGIAGAFQGYRGLLNGSVFGNKNKPATSYSVTGNAKSNINPMTSSPRIGPQRFEDLPQQQQQMQSWKGIPYDMKTEGGGINNPGFNALPDYVQEKIIANMQYGGLPDAQFGIPPGFDFNDPYGLQQPRFGQTANYADTKGYPQNKSRIDYDKLNNFSIGPGINDNASLSYGDPYAADGVNRQVPKQTTMTPASAYGNGVTPYGKVNQPKTNEKVIKNVSGRQMANNSLLALSAANFALGEDKRGPRPMTEAERQESLLQNPQNYSGIYTPNVQGGGNDYLPATYTGIQNYGTTGNVIAKAGGQMNFAAGGQYKVSHEQLLQLLRDGAEIEFL
mgnify:CR=1 FL=1